MKQRPQPLVLQPLSVSLIHFSASNAGAFHGPRSYQDEVHAAQIASYKAACISVPVLGVCTVRPPQPLALTASLLTAARTCHADALAYKPPAKLQSTKLKSKAAADALARLLHLEKPQPAERMLHDPLIVPEEPPAVLSCMLAWDAQGSAAALNMRPCQQLPCPLGTSNTTLQVSLYAALFPHVQGLACPSGKLLSAFRTLCAPANTCRCGSLASHCSQPQFTSWPAQPWQSWAQTAPPEQLRQPLLS